MAEWVSTSCQVEGGLFVGVEYLQNTPGGLYAPLGLLDSPHLAF
jgi:hypothetical protein